MSDCSLIDSLFVDVLAKLACDVLLSERINESLRLLNDDNDVDFFGDLLPILLAALSSSLSERTYKFPTFSLIIFILSLYMGVIYIHKNHYYCVQMVHNLLYKT